VWKLCCYANLEMAYFVGTRGRRAGPKLIKIPCEFIELKQWGGGAICQLKNYEEGVLENGREEVSSAALDCCIP
jgi:hypothetical protein